MAALLPGGSTRAWRTLREVVLARDRWTCQCPCPPTRATCDRPASTAGHIVARCHGGPDTLDNLRAECARCNYSHGGRLRAAPPRSRW